jgi:hypothetical protein
MLTTQISDLLGTWRKGSASVTFVHFDDEHVRVTNSAGDDGVITANEAQARIDLLRDDGWHRSNQTISVSAKDRYWKRGVNLDKATLRLLADRCTRQTVVIPPALLEPLVAATREREATGG